MLNVTATSRMRVNMIIIWFISIDMYIHTVLIIEIIA